MKQGWISIPIGNHRKPTVLPTSTSAYVRALLDEFTLDEIGGQYWGSRVSNFSNVNHRYFAWPGAERGEYKRVPDRQPASGEVTSRCGSSAGHLAVRGARDGGSGGGRGAGGPRLRQGARPRAARPPFPLTCAQRRP